MKLKMVGLGKMGFNLALNMKDHEVDVEGFDVNEEARKKVDAYASVISNNLNIVMKVLAIITIVMSIPTMIASFWGMNVPVPLAHSAHGFLILVIVSLILTIFGGYILGKKNMF